MKFFKQIVFLLAAFGLALSALVHQFALFGKTPPMVDPNLLVSTLMSGLFAVWIPTILISTWITWEFKAKDFWKSVFRGCPTWMKYLTNGIFGYAIVNFIIIIILDMIAGFPKHPRSHITPLDMRGFSGHFMAFYSAAMATMYSSLHAAEHDAARRCLNGHPVSPAAKFCEECWAAVREPIQ